MKNKIFEIENIIFEIKKRILKSNQIFEIKTKIFKYKKQVISNQNITI